MRKLTLTIIAALNSALLSWAGPEITWLTLRHNFGAFDEEHGPVAYDFRFVNTGDAPLTVLAARASCGCTRPLYPSEAVAPGDTAVISVAYNPEGRPGRFNKSVSIETDAVNQPKTKLSIQGVVIGAVSSVAGQFPVDMGTLKFNKGAVMFGQVERPRLKTVFTNAYNRSSDSIRPRVVTKPRYVDIAFEPKTVGPGEQLTVISYFRSADSDLWGLVEDSVIISTGSEQFALPFTAIVKEDFSSLSPSDIEKAPVVSLSDNNVDFGRLEPGKVASRTVTLTNSGQSTLEVRRVYTADRGVTVSIDHTSIKKGKSATITITADPNLLPDKILNARISLITNDPLSPTQTIRAVGEVK